MTSRPVRRRHAGAPDGAQRACRPSRHARSTTPASADDPPVQHHPARGRQHPYVVARVLVVDHQVRRRALVEAGPAEPAPGAPGGRRERLDGRDAGLDQLGDLGGDQAVRRASRPRRCRRRPGCRRRTPRARCRSGARAAAACGPTSAGTWPRRPPRGRGNVAMLTRVGTMATPRSAKSGMVSSVRPVACSMQSMPASTRSRERVLGEAVRGDPGAEPVRLGDRRLDGRPRGQQARQVAGVRGRSSRRPA